MESESKRTNAPGARKRPPLREEDIVGLKYFGRLRKVFSVLHDEGNCPNRKLHYDKYTALILMYFLNPVLTSLRSIEQASRLERVQRKLRVGHASLGSLSESARVFDPELLGQIVEEMAGRAQAGDAPARPEGLDEALEVIARDGSLLPMLPKVAWALWLDEEHRAAKVHLEFNVLKGVPRMGRIRAANAGECAAMRQEVQAGKLYLYDAGLND
jgi:hypothetical protein